MTLKDPIVVWCLQWMTPDTSTGVCGFLSAMRGTNVARLTKAQTGGQQQQQLQSHHFLMFMGFNNNLHMLLTAQVFHYRVELGC